MMGNIYVRGMMGSIYAWDDGEDTYIHMYMCVI